MVVIPDQAAETIDLECQARSAGSFSGNGHQIKVGNVVAAAAVVDAVGADAVVFDGACRDEGSVESGMGIGFGCSVRLG